MVRTNNKLPGTVHRCSNRNFLIPKCRDKNCINIDGRSDELTMLSLVYPCLASLDAGILAYEACLHYVVDAIKKLTYHAQ